MAIFFESISHFDINIGFCKALGVLNISDNKIKVLPPQLGSLPNLRFDTTFSSEKSLANFQVANAAD